MQRTKNIPERCGEHRTIFFIEGEYDPYRSLDCGGSIQHVPFNLSGLRPVHCLDPLRFQSLPAAATQ